MAKLIYVANMSLDGYTEDRDGGIDWGPPDEEYFGFINDLERSVGTYLYGRRMYEAMVYWESAPLADQPPWVADVHQHLASGRQGRFLEDTGNGVKRQDHP